MKADPTMQILAERMEHEARIAILLTASERVVSDGEGIAVYQTPTQESLARLLSSVSRLDRAVRALRNSELFDRRHA